MEGCCPPIFQVGGWLPPAPTPWLCILCYSQGGSQLPKGGALHTLNETYTTNNNYTFHARAWSHTLMKYQCHIYSYWWHCMELNLCQNSQAVIKLVEQKSWYGCWRCSDQSIRDVGGSGNRELKYWYWRIWMNCWMLMTIAIQLSAFDPPADCRSDCWGWLK